MEFRRKSLPIKQGLLHRPRIDALLKKGMRHSLVTVVAGLGYGKTQAVASFVKDLKNVLWVNLSSFDDIAPRFWQSFVWPIREVLPGLAMRLDSLGFPDTPAKFDAFLRLVAGEIYGGKRVVLVVDDFGNIQSDEIKHFFEHILEANLENFCLLLISSTKTDVDVACLKGGGSVFRITTEDLKFTREETRELFQLYELPLSDKMLGKLDDTVDGWPLGLYLLTMHFRCIPDPGDYEADVDVSLAFGLFEKECFSNYPADTQKLLVRLSLLQGFTVEVVRAVCGEDFTGAMTAIESNIFITYDGTSRLFTFQKVYREFLSQKQFLISSEEIQGTYSAAGDWFFENGQSIEATYCYGKCGSYDRMFEAILRFPRSQSMSRGLGAFFAQHLDLLPPDFLERNPMAVFTRASIHVNNLELDEAFAILTLLEERLGRKRDAKSRALLGEICILLAAIVMMRNAEGFVEYYKKADRCLPLGSRFLTRDVRYLNNNSFLFLPDNKPGTLERMERSIFEAVTYMERLMHGGARGMDYFFSAEAAYYTLALEEAKIDLFQAIYRGQENEQHDVVCNGYQLRALIALMQGDYQEASGSIKQIGEYIESKKLTFLFNLRDCSESWFYLKMGDLDKVSPWILSDEGETRDQAPIDEGREKLIYAYYLIRKQDYHKLLVVAERLEGLYLRRGLWLCRLALYVMQAIGYLKTGDRDKSADALWKGYEMSRDNGIITPFVEAAWHMRPLADAARESRRHSFDEQWLEEVSQKASDYAKRLSAAMNLYAKERHKQSNAGLSQRETEVLLALARGSTREEIAAFHAVSVNTIKSQIKNIYNKLGAVNRADAIHIAMKLGIME